MEISVFYFHAYHTGQLSGFAQPPGNAVGKGQKIMVGLIFIRNILRQRDRVAHSFCIRRGRYNISLINAVGVFP